MGLRVQRKQNVDVDGYAAAAYVGDVLMLDLDASSPSVDNDDDNECVRTTCSCTVLER